MKRIITIIILMVAIRVINAQTPTGFSYQAIVRNSAGQVLPNQDVVLRVSLISNDESTTYYSELHSKRSNAQGIVNLCIVTGKQIGRAHV